MSGNKFTVEERIQAARICVTVEERIQAARICGEGKMSASKIPAYNKYC